MTPVEYAVRWKITNIYILLDKTKYNKKKKKKLNSDKKHANQNPE